MAKHSGQKPRCLDSILAQTCRDLDIILIDDGSPDGCGRICDQYAEKDSRIRVFHTPNGGLSKVRNLGIEKALEHRSDYIAFADSDDWLEPTMYGKMHDIAQSTGCDVVVCGCFMEGNDSLHMWSKPEKRMDQTEAIRELVMGRLTNVVWNKLWRAACFSSIRFPSERVYEDISIVYRILDQIHDLIRIPDPLYHYNCAREDSIVRAHGLSSLMDRWFAYKTRYDVLSRDERFADDQPFQIKLETGCAQVIFSAWRWLAKAGHEQRRAYAAELNEMSDFMKRHFPLFSGKQYEWVYKVFSLLARIHDRLPLLIIGSCGFLIPLYQAAKKRRRRK